MTHLSRPEIVHFSANLATLLFGFFIVVQLLVATGILPTTILWGGRRTELTPALRITGVAASIILGLFIYVVRYRAGLVGSVPPPMVIRVTAWAVAGYMAVNTLGNFASVNPVEKKLFGPMTVLLTIACLLVAASSSP